MTSFGEQDLCDCLRTIDVEELNSLPKRDDHDTEVDLQPKGVGLPVSSLELSLLCSPSLFSSQVLLTPGGLFQVPSSSECSSGP